MENIKYLFNLIGKPVVYFDLETTSLDLENTEIIELALMKYDGVNFTEFESRFNFEFELTEEANYKHSIGKYDVKHLPLFKDCVKDIYEYFKDECVLVGYNIKQFDVPILLDRFTKYGLLVNHLKTIIDIYQVYRKYNPNDLQSVYTRLTGSSFENAHAAKNDIIASIEVLDILIQKSLSQPVDILDEYTMLDLDGFFIISENKVKMNKGKFKDKFIADIDKKELRTYCSWLVNAKDISNSTKLIANKVIDKLNSL